MPLGSSLIIETVCQHVKTAHISMGTSSMHSRDAWSSDRQRRLLHKFFYKLSNCCQYKQYIYIYIELINASIPTSYWLQLIQWASGSIINNYRLAAEVANQALIGRMSPSGNALAFFNAMALHRVFQRHVSTVGKCLGIANFSHFG